jgi:hypothetical protein
MSRRTRRKLNKGEEHEFGLYALSNTKNILGVVMFIWMLITLIVGEGSTTNIVIKTPLVTPTQKNPRFFEIRNNKVTYIDDEKVGKEIEHLTSDIPPCVQSEIPSSQAYELYRACLRDRASQLINFESQTNYYNVRMVNASTFSLMYEPIESKPGESKNQLPIPTSNFNQVLAKLNPKKDYLAFIVRPDSFATFRIAREQAWKKGYNVGWEPHPTELPIIFGSGGRAIEAQ